MKNQFKILLTIVASINLFGCGGGGGSGSLDFDSVVVSIAGVKDDNGNPPPINVSCNVVYNSSGTCVGEDFQSEIFVITFNSQTIKNAQGQPVTSNPSPVYVEKFKLSLSNCLSGVYEFSVGATLYPDKDTEVKIQNMRFFANLCPQQYSPLICDTIANMEFYLVEQYSGKRKTIVYPIDLRIEGQQCK